MTSFLSILAKSSGAVDQNLAVDKGNNGDVLISTTTGFSFVAANTLTPNLSQVLFVGNTATNNINLNGNVSANTFIGNLTGTATTADNLTGGSGGSIPYQSAANTTALLPNGSNGQYLKSLGSTNPPVWDNFPVISTPNLSQVLSEGNTATNNILLNNTGVGTNVISLLPNVGVADPQITLTDGTTTNTINKNGYTTRNSVQNITHYLNFSDNSATGTGAIQKTTGIECNPSTKTVSATTFIGNLTGLSTTSTNIAGGSGGSIPYQSAASTTALLANGTAGQYLKSLGSTNPPVWENFPVISPNLSQVLFVGNTATNDINLTGNISANTFIGNLTGIATSATTATTATRATNIAGGSGGSIPYQSAANTTALLANGTAGQVLTSAGTTLAPTWTTPSSGGVSSANTNLLYDDFMSCPSNNPITPLGLMGIQASTTSAFLSPYTGTKIPGYSGVIQLLNPLSVVSTCWDIQNFQPFSFDNLPIGASTVPLGMTHKFFGDLVYTANVVQYIGVFSTLSSSIATMTSTVPNVFITVQFTSGVNGQLIYYVNGVNSGGFTVAMSTISSWYNFGIRRTAASTYQLLGLFGTSGTYTNITAPMYLRCGSYTTSAIGQSARIYVDSCNVQLNTR